MNKKIMIIFLILIFSSFIVNGFFDKDYFIIDNSGANETYINDTYVPYNGATGNVDIGTYDFSATNGTFNGDVSTTGDTSIMDSPNGFVYKSVGRPASTLSLALTTGGSLDQSALYYYTYTYYTDIGETPIVTTTYSITTTTTDKSVTLSNIPISTDDRVLGRKIYRTYGGESRYSLYLIATIPNNIMTVYVDTLPDTSLSGNNAYFKPDTTSYKLKDGDTTVFSPGINTYRAGYNAGSDTAYGGRNAFAGAGVMSSSSNDAGTDSTGFGYSIGYQGKYSRSVGIGTYAMGAIQEDVTASIAIGYQASFGAYGQSRTPNYDIAIGGNANENANGDYVTAIGYNAGRYQGGSYNNFIGGYSGRGDSGTNTGQWNVGLGYQTLFSLGTGSGNIAIGHEALEDLEDTSYSTATGFNSGKFSQGGNNAYYGGYSGTGFIGTSTATYNSAFGYQAGNDISTSGQNSYFGALSGAETTGGYNSFVGSNCGRYVTTGNYNVAMGFNTFSSSAEKATGSSNVFLGSYSAEKATSARNNVAIGYMSGRELTSGSYNVFMGRMAGRYTNTQSGQFIVNSYDQGDYAHELTDSIIVGQMTDNDPDNQYIQINAQTNITQNLNIEKDLKVHGNVSFQNPHLNAFDNSTQNFLTLGTAQVMNLTNNGYHSHQIYIVNQQNITFDRVGHYQLCASPQFYQTSGMNKEVEFWLQKNGVDVEWSNSRYTMDNGEYYAPHICWEIVIVNPSTENARVMWTSDSTSSQLISVDGLTSPTRPGIPSVIMNVELVSNGD